MVIKRCRVAVSQDARQNCETLCLSPRFRVVRKVGEGEVACRSVAATRCDVALSRVGRSIQALPAGPVSLIGSSLGAFVALHLAAIDSQGGLKSARQDLDSSRIERLVLLAPAFDFGKNQMPGLDAGEFDRWQQSGHLQVFHHAFGEMRPVHYELYSNASRYDSFAVQLNKPIMIFQGKHDDVVDPKVVARFATERSNVQVHWLDDGHQLLNSLEFIWSELTTFLHIES